MLSNIHTVRATWNPQEERTWKFAPKAQTTNNSLFLPFAHALHEVGEGRWAGVNVIASSQLAAKNHSTS